MKIKKYAALSIYFNRFSSLISEYGYTILINILLSRISVQLVMYFWVVKCLAAIVTNRINISNSKLSRKYLLILLEITKAILLFLLGFGLNHIIVLLVVFIIEVVNVLFSSLLYSCVPIIIDKDSLIKFNARYTSIGSVSYFLAPLFVGLFINKSHFLLFAVYALLLIVGATSLLFLPNISTLKLKEERKKQNLNITLFNILRSKKIALVLLSGVIVGSIGVVYDTYEVVYLTKYLGISDSMYSFSLSFLAVSFLVMSFLLSFVKQISSHMKAFALGLSFYVLYLLLFSTSSNIYTVLMSYVFLAIGQTMMGIIETNYFQLSLNMKELQKLYIYSETLHSVFSGIAVLVIGSFAFLSSHLVLVFRSLAVFALFILLCYCVFVNLKKLSIDK